METITVLGARGMLGHAVAEYFSRRRCRVIRVGREEFDIAREPLDRLERLIDGATCVINCAGVIKPRIAANTIEDVLRINAIFPRNLAKLCDRHGVRAFHVTTDCAFSGLKGSYDERDFFDGEDVYGLSKNAGDTADSMVLRTSIIGEECGAQRSLLEWARSQAGRAVRGFVNHHWNGVTTLHLAEVVEAILREGLHERGIFHVHSPETLSKYELLALISEVYELELRVEPVAFDTPCDRSLASVHPLSGRLCRKPVRQQLEELRRFFAS